MRPWCPCARGSSPGSVLRSSGNCPSDPCTRQEQWCRVQSVHTRLPFEINRLVVVFIINDFDVCFVLFASNLKKKMYEMKMIGRRLVLPH